MLRILTDSIDEDPSSDARESSKSPQKKSKLFESLFGCFKTMTNAYWFEWYIQQYTAQTCNFNDIRKVSFYIARLIGLGAPRYSDGSNWHTADSTYQNTEEPISEAEGTVDGESTNTNDRYSCESKFLFIILCLTHFTISRCMTI